MHRFEPEKRLAFVRDMKARGLISSISVGVKENDYEFIRELKAQELVPDYITIDIAH